MKENQYNLEFQKSIRPSSLLFVGSNDMNELFAQNQKVRRDYFRSFSEALFIVELIGKVTMEKGRGAF